MYCKYCGKRISKDSVFCSFCGERIVPTPNSDPKLNLYQNQSLLETGSNDEQEQESADVESLNSILRQSSRRMRKMKEYKELKIRIALVLIYIPYFTYFVFFFAEENSTEEAHFVGVLVALFPLIPIVLYKIAEEIKKHR